MISDEELTFLLKEGSLEQAREALKEIINREAGLLFSFLVSSGLDENYVEQLVEDYFAELWRNREKCETSYRQWLYKI